jgi:predicted Zn-dependent peptidase
MSSRLFQKVREKEGLCYSVYSFHSSYSNLGVFGIYCGTSPQKYDKAKELILNECKSLVNAGISEVELQDAKTFMKGNLALSLESTEVRMGQIARNEIIYGRHYGFDDIIKNIDAVHLDDFNRIAQKILKDKQITLVSIGNLKNSKDETLII